MSARDSLPLLKLHYYAPYSIILRYYWLESPVLFLPYLLKLSRIIKVVCILLIQGQRVTVDITQLVHRIRHVFYFFTMSWRRFECLVSLYKDLKWAFKNSACYFFTDKFGTTSGTPKGYVTLARHETWIDSVAASTFFDCATPPTHLIIASTPISSRKIMMSSWWKRPVHFLFWRSPSLGGKGSYSWHDMKLYPTASLHFLQRKQYMKTDNWLLLNLWVAMRQVLRPSTKFRFRYDGVRLLLSGIRLQRKVVAVMYAFSPLPPN